MRVLVVGMGFVGTMAAELLVAAGHECWGLRRSSRAMPSGVKALLGNVSTGEGLEEIPKDVDAVIYAVSPDERSEEAYDKAFVQGLAHLKAQCPASRVVFVSSTAVYSGDESDRWVDDDTTPDATSFNGRKLLAAEDLLEPTDVAVRATGIYGPGRISLLGRLVRNEVPPQHLSTWTNRIFAHDLARALVFLAEQADLSGSFIASDREPCQLGEMQKWARARDWPAWLYESSESDSAFRQRKSRRILGQRLVDAGFAFEFPTFREGYGRIREQLLAGEFSSSRLPYSRLH